MADIGGKKREAAEMEARREARRIEEEERRLKAQMEHDVSEIIKDGMAKEKPKTPSGPKPMAVRVEDVDPGAGRSRSRGLDRM